MIILDPYKKLKKENMVVIRKWEFLGTHMDKSREVEEQNRLRD